VVLNIIGSGKSTLLISLLRIVEAVDGKILIDDIDISGMSLKNLRSRVAIIPQGKEGNCY